MKTTIIIILGILAVGLIWITFFQTPYLNGGEEETRMHEETINTGGADEEKDMSLTDDTHITLHTTKGDIVIRLYGETMPITAGNFYTLAKDGFYDGTKFHRVIEGFIIQGGDPNSRSENTALYGQGGPGYTIEDEFVKGLSNLRGTIAMANAGPNSGGSQFFINLADNTGLDFDKEPLTSKHPVFGEVVEGMDVVSAIASVDTTQRDIPASPIIIESVLFE